MKHGGASKIAVRIETSDRVYVAYQDDGTGVPENVRDRVFEKGFSTAGSTGMGLFIVKKLLESFGGDIRLEKSESGVKFVLIFPLEKRT